MSEFESETSELNQTPPDTTTLILRKVRAIAIMLAIIAAVTVSGLTFEILLATGAIPPESAAGLSVLALGVALAVFLNLG